MTNLQLFGIAASVKKIRDLERVQKVAVRVILGKNYTNYDDELSKLNLKTLNTRRENLCLNFAKKCLRNEKWKNMFPKNNRSHTMKFNKIRGNHEIKEKKNKPL